MNGPASSGSGVLSGSMAAIDLGILCRAAVVTSTGETLLTCGRYIKDDRAIVREVVGFLSRNKVSIVAVGETRGRLLFPMEYFRHKCRCLGILTVLGTEYMSSRRCPACRKCHPPTDSRIFSCSRCGFTIDRDLAAAMNIYQDVFGEKTKPAAEARKQNVSAVKTQERQDLLLVVS